MTSTSRLTAQAQVSIPAAVRRKLGIGPGSVVAWVDEGDRIVVRRVGRYSSSDIHAALFGGKASIKGKGPGNVKAGIRAYVRKRHARR